MFRRKEKKAPTVKSESFDLAWDQKYGCWTLSYKGIEFSFKGAEITLPRTSDLDTYIGWVDANQEHIDRQAKRLAEPWEDVHIDATKAHVAQIEVETPSTIAVMILGDESWGDMGYDVWIENGSIIKDGFGD